jgi:hypothetical protein
LISLHGGRSERRVRSVMDRSRDDLLDSASNDIWPTMPIRCQCGAALVLDGGAVNLFPNTSCPTCNTVIWFSEDGLVHTRALVKAWNELQSNDFILGIIFSAVAVECKLGRIFTKWKNIESGLMTQRPSAFQENQWVGSLRSFGILQNLDRVCDFLTGQSFDVFLNGQRDLAKSVHERHPTSVSVKSLRAFFNQKPILDNGPNCTSRANRLWKRKRGRGLQIRPYPFSRLSAKWISVGTAA